MKKDEPTKEDMRIYRRLIKASLKRKKLTEICIRLEGEYHQIRNIKPLCISSKLQKAIEQVPTLEGWRKNIWINLQETIFRKTKELPYDNKFYKFGASMAMLQNLNYGLEKTLKSEPRPPGIATILKPYALTGKEELSQAKKSLQHLNKCLKVIEKEAPKLPPSVQEKIAQGEADSAMAVYDDEGKYRYRTDATPIYCILLYFGGDIEKLSSRKKMYFFLKILLRKDMPHDEDAFYTICKRIGLKGSRGREIEKRKARVTVKRA